MTVNEPTAMSLILRPRSGDGQWIEAETYQLDPLVPATQFTDASGNLCQRLVAQPGSFDIRVMHDVQVADEIDVDHGVVPTPPAQLPSFALPYMLPSRYCESDELLDMANEVTEGCQLGYDQADAIRAYIHGRFEYKYGTSDATTSAAETAKQKQGVCRDFSHLGIALCRALHLPARMVVGYLHELDPMDQHAWYEVFINDRWYTFDATQNQAKGGRVCVAYGRDAADVAFITQWGNATLDEMQVGVERLD
jgi:transglutaminase-like putative cysteine protease